MKASYLALVVLIGGCVSPEQAAYNRQLQAQQEQYQREAYHARLAANCDAMGFQRGTQGHSNCMLTLHQQNQANMGAAAAALIQGEQLRQLQSMPSCASLPPGIAGYARAQGTCR